MNKYLINKIFVVTVSAFLLLAVGSGVTAQTRVYRATDTQVGNSLRTLEADADTFASALETALDRSSWNDTATEDEIKDYIVAFEQATDRLKQNFDRRSSVRADVEELMTRAANIDRFLAQYRFNNQVTRNWNLVRADLKTLAGYYSVPFNLNQTTANNTTRNNNFPNNGNNNQRGNRINGTYRLDTARSTDLNAEIDRAVSSLNVNQQDRVRRVALRRLESPDEIAIERTNRTVTIASTTAPRVTFEADGRARTEQNANGRSVTVTSTIFGDQITINYAGDRVNDFYVAFNPTANGNELRVTKRIYLEGVNRQITADSIYTKSSTTAQLDSIFRGGNNTVSGNNGDNTAYDTQNGQFVIPNGSQVVAVLREDLNTKTAREGDRFTMEVRSPSNYNGAVIEGKVGRVKRSGRVSGSAELELDFETIRLRDGKTYNFEGAIDNIGQTNGNDVKIDNEGAVREGDSQTKKTVGRTAIGAGIGAIIGAIVGGGQGAAIGAGAGAGSVILQGRDDLNLKAGTEITLSSNAPRTASQNR